MVPESKARKKQAPPARKAAAKAAARPSRSRPLTLDERLLKLEAASIRVLRAIEASSDRVLRALEAGDRKADRKVDRVLRAMEASAERQEAAAKASAERQEAAAKAAAERQEAAAKRQEAAAKRQEAEQAAAAKRQAAEQAAAAKRQEAALAAEQAARQAWMKDLGGQWGNFTDGDGRLLEMEGVLALDELSELGGMPVEEVLSALQLRRKGREYDGLIYCPGARVLVEFKRRLRRGDVARFAEEQLGHFAEDFPELVNGRALYGAVIGALIDEDARQLAEAEGLFVLHMPAKRTAVVLNNQARPRTNGNGRP